MAPGHQPPSRLYRTAVRQTLTQYRPRAGVDPEEDFRDFLQACYREERARLESLKASEAGPQESLMIKNGLFVLATGLFAFGRIEVAEDLLDYLPSSGGIRKLALALQALLPLPEGLEPWRDQDAIRAWLRQHKKRLRWDEAQGRYVASHGAG